MRCIHFTLLSLTIFCLMDSLDAATIGTIKLCGHKLTLFMSEICQAFNSPWDDDQTVIDQAQARHKRELGIADVCCTIGCTWSAISEYCLVSPKYEKSPPFDLLETHMIEDRNAKKTTTVETSAEAVVSESYERNDDDRRPVLRSKTREVGRFRRHGYRRGRCWCILYKDRIKYVARAAPVVGTVSPLLMWARTL